MEITTRSLWTLIHGMGFGALYLLGCSGLLVEYIRNYFRSADSSDSGRGARLLRVYLIAMAVLAWVTVLTGAYVIYPWYRAAPPAGTVGWSGFPQALLQSNPGTIAWHSIGMEWKEHVAWLVPIATTMAAAVVGRYGRALRQLPQLRAAVLGFLILSFAAAGIAGFFGSMLNKKAPVEGGETIHLPRGGS
jgi:hypothetical protein